MRAAKPVQQALSVSRGNGLPAFVQEVWRVSEAVFLLVAVVVLIGIVLTKTPTNGSNVIVRNALRLAGEAVGPCKVVFAPKKPQDALVVNYLLAAVVYGVLGVVVGRLPTGRRR